MSKFLDALGLPPPPATAKAGASPTPTGLGMRSGDDKAGKKPYDLDLPGLTCPRTSNPDDPKKQPDFKLPTDPKAQVGLLADAIARTSDAVKRDKLVQMLRAAIVKIQPVMSDPEAKKAIDKLIDKGIDAAAKAALMKLIELAVGKGASQAPDPDKPHPTGPNVKEGVPGEHIFKTPEIPFGKPPAVQRGSFEFRGLPKSAKAGSFIDVQVLTPHWFSPEPPSTYLVVVSSEAYKKNDLSGGDRAPRIDSKGTLKLSVHLPDEPGSYVVLLQSGGRAEQTTPVEPIELK